MTRKVALQYFEGCPNWRTTADHLARLADEGLDVTVDHEIIDSHETAVAREFHGSPTVLIDGVDPFAEESMPIGLACRVYRTPYGMAGSPTLSQIRQALTADRGAWAGMPASIHRTALLQLIEDEDAQIVDVLPEPEYTEAHLPEAVNIPLQELDADSVTILSKDRPVVVYCHDGL